VTVVLVESGVLLILNVGRERIMKKLTSMFLAGVVSIGSMGNVLADKMPDHFLQAENFSGTIAFTSNYAFRGTSFSNNDAALQASIDWGYGPWFVGTWGTNTTSLDDDGLGANLEVDFYGGWADALGGFDLMVMPLVYTYPGQEDDDSRNDLTFELWTSIGRGIENVPGSPYISVAFNYSPEFFDGGDEAFYIKPSIAFTLPYGLGLDFAYGYQDVGGVASATNKGNEFFADDYEHIEVGVTKSVIGFDFDARYHDNLDEDVIGSGFALDNRFVFTLSRSF
jgi:uncharacterized protein (TIGR02001 family)